LIYFLFLRILYGLGGCWWLPPVILATQEAEIRRMGVQSQLCINSWRDPILKIPNTKQDWQNDSSSRVPA
jgi:hypothetical protein